MRPGRIFPDVGSGRGALYAFGGGVSGELKRERGREEWGEIVEAEPVRGAMAAARAKTTEIVQEVSASQHLARTGVLHSVVLEDSSEGALSP
jgi:hypothetical protein